MAKRWKHCKLLRSFFNYCREAIPTLDEEQRREYVTKVSNFRHTLDQKTEKNPNCDSKLMAFGALIVMTMIHSFFHPPKRYSLFI